MLHQQSKAFSERRTQMPVREILQLGNPQLRDMAARIEHPSSAATRSLIEDLADTLAHWRASTGYGRAIAAPQIGVGSRAIFLQLPGKSAMPFINPEIIERSADKIVVWDTCLSFLSMFMQVERHRAIKIRYQDLASEWQEANAGDELNLSELLQHEIDHLDGILAIDRMVDVKTLCVREEFEKRYKASSPYADTMPVQTS
jgi:peptide deformylase